MSFFPFTKEKWVENAFPHGDRDADDQIASQKINDVVMDKIDGPHAHPNRVEHGRKGFPPVSLQQEDEYEK